MFHKIILIFCLSAFALSGCFKSDKKTPRVVEEDTTVPAITLQGTSLIYIEAGTTYVDAGATAADNNDGDITADIIIVNNVDTSTFGTYTVTYNVTDSSDNSAVEGIRVVKVVTSVERCGDIPEACEDAMVQIEGRYAHFDVVAQIAEVVFVEGGLYKTLIISYGFTDFEVVDGELIETDSFCHAEYISNDTSTTTRTPDEFTQAIIPRETTVDIFRVDGSWVIWRPETPTFIGFDQDSSIPLPDEIDISDPRIADDDDDGDPGITVYVTLFGIEEELYLARREIFAYDLLLQADDSLTGYVKDSSEQLVIGASNDLLLSSPEPDQYEDMSQSPIMLIPLEGIWDCDRLMGADGAALLPPIPEIW